MIRSISFVQFWHRDEHHSSLLLFPIILLVSKARQTKTRLFVDDTNVFIVSDDPILLKENSQNTLFDLSEWFAANKLSLNKDKSCYSIFFLPAKLSTVPGYLNTIRLDNMIIKRVHHAKYFGLILRSFKPMIVLWILYMCIKWLAWVLAV